MTEWRIVRESPNHEISEYGEVRRRNKVRNHPAGRTLRTDVSPNGYLRITLMSNGRKVRRPVHRFVCETWHGPRPTPKHEVSHDDGNKLNNHFSNLRWATHLENEAEKKRHGTSTPRAKLSLEQVGLARQLFASGKASKQELASNLSVCVKTVSDAIAGRTWK